MADAPTYPTNAAGLPEFASILLTFDHLANREDHHVVQKIVLSTQSDVETLLSLFAYYGETHLTAQASTIEVLRQGGAAANPIYVYTSPQNVQVLASTPAWDLLVQTLGSSLLAVDFITKQVANIHGQLQSQTGAFVPLFLIDFDPTHVDEAEEASDAAEYADPAPGVAEALVKGGARFENVTTGADDALAGRGAGTVRYHDNSTESGDQSAVTGE